MRKTLITGEPTEEGPGDPPWLKLDQVAQVEISSEEPAYPIEAALQPGGAGGWRAAQPGPQTIRLRFDRPQHLRRIWLVFTALDGARTQEFVLRWAADGGTAAQEIVRQQWTFSPPQTSREVEDYHVDLAGVTLLELQIVPDMRGGAARAALAEWRVA